MPQHVCLALRQGEAVPYRRLPPFAQLADFLARRLDGELHLDGTSRTRMHGQAHAHFRDMVSQRSNAIGVKPGGAGFACGVSIAADPALSARNPSQERGPVNSLE